MALIEIRNFSFTYAGEDKRLLKDISLLVEEGEMVLLCGPTGCGKTTLLRQMKKEIAPIGTRSGSIYFDQKEMDSIPSVITAKEIGIVFQDPENQIVTSTVWHELAFSLENFGYSTFDIRKKVAEMASFFGIEAWLNLSIHELSGGQKQLVNLASVLLLQPRVLLLDEPTAQLDPIAAREFLQMIHRINQEFNTTIVIIEHRLEEVFPIVDRVVILEDGKIKLQGTPQQVIKQIDKNDAYFQYLPEITKLFLISDENWLLQDQVPITVREGRKWLSKQNDRHFPKGVQGNLLINKKEVTGTSILECKDVFFQYDRSGKMVLEGVQYGMTKGMFSAIIGGNGAGKSTLLKILAGIENPRRGKVLIEGHPLHKMKVRERYNKIGYLSQNPLALFTQDTVKEELTVAEELVDGKRSTNALAEAIEFFGLERALHKHPYDLSGGERQKLALASVLLKNPEILLIDEPTKGLDPILKLDVGNLLKELQRKGISILMVTHDIEFAAKYADHCSLLFAGSIVAEGTAKEMFSDNYFYTTAINRLVRGDLPQALNYEDVLKAWDAVGCY
ncbi:energy-coupling factor transporter ATPase [Schinkia azotoformans]|uniref:ABC transporter ATP-binding protein n=1 Tax=Schinkia azotoformans LMG 9581 TaxID=1131731 RepID=K6D446_SCHAZ|nr:energy-coupling factor transporter ATPase [Schinkia azotoformans]EKN63029.1 ABC transporter ATP-binding protein [Schinkia azotoformans LMG 9581]MEC1639094.1 energy-coupling factor transporter ATPase [Schinkia azotoformans]MEC1722323.1 energy-coupling factor transporter ATPase [Schinkia azotoformans]MEC1945123.1 energy-coupling factor transporter ATPase [Schinkia azotoformans]MED4414581.1 energy-coupling factor transporter ATPase [Schinkia azotoformans]